MVQGSNHLKRCTFSTTFPVNYLLVESGSWQLNLILVRFVNLKCVKFNKLQKREAKQGEMLQTTIWLPGTCPIFPGSLGVILDDRIQPFSEGLARVLQQNVSDKAGSTTECNHNRKKVKNVGRGGSSQQKIWCAKFSTQLETLSFALFVSQFCRTQILDPPLIREVKTLASQTNKCNMNLRLPGQPCRWGRNWCWRRWDWCWAQSPCSFHWCGFCRCRYRALCWPPATVEENRPCEEQS